MDSQLQQLRDAVKAVAKARAEGKPIDLSTLPPAIRDKIEAQLKKLPPDARAQLQKSGMAKVEQIAQRASGHSPVGTPVMPHYHGHFNGTIRPGDASRFPWMWVAAVIVGGVLLVRFAG